MASLPRDPNNVVVAGGVYNDGSGTIVPLPIDPNTGNLLVTAVIGSGGSTVLSVSGTGRLVAQTGAAASVATVTVGSSDASYYASANVNVTTTGTFGITAVCTYTDETGTSRSLTMSFSTTGGSIVNGISAVAGLAAYAGLPVHVRAKAGTTITVSTTGTFTSVTYNVEAYVVAL